MARLILAVLAAALAATPSLARTLPPGAFSSGAAGTTGAAFLKTAGGARAAAMGGVAAASGAGAEAAFLNPAVLGRLNHESPKELAVGYDALLETSYAGFGAFAAPAGEHGAFAAGFVHASQGAQTEYNALGDSVGSFKPSDVALAGWYARRLGSSVSLGGGLKIIRSSIADRSGSTAAGDFGVLARHVADLGDAPLDLGASIVNLGPPLKVGETADPLPLRVRMGAQARLNPSFDAALDLLFPVDQDPYVTLGIEARLPSKAVRAAKPWSACVRGGFDQSRTRGVEGFAGFSAGAGLDLSGFRLDYAWLPFGDLGSVNRITLAFRF